MYTNTVFSKEEEATQFANKSKKRNYDFKVVEYTKENYDRYWY